MKQIRRKLGVREPRSGVRFANLNREICDEISAFNDFIGPRYDAHRWQKKFRHRAVVASGVWRGSGESISWGGWPEYTHRSARLSENNLTERKVGAPARGDCAQSPERFGRSMGINGFRSAARDFSQPFALRGALRFQGPVNSRSSPVGGRGEARLTKSLLDPG